MPRVHCKNYVNVCERRRSGLATFWSVNVSVCRHLDLSKFWLVPVSVCRRFGLLTLVFINVLVSRHFGLLTFWLSTFRFVEALTSYPLIYSIISTCGGSHWRSRCSVFRTEDYGLSPWRPSGHLCPLGDFNSTIMNASEDSRGYGWYASLCSSS